MMETLKKVRTAMENVATAVKVVLKRWDVMLAVVLPIAVPLLILRYVTHGQLSQLFQYALGLVTPIAGAVAAVVVDEETRGGATVARVLDRLRGRWPFVIAMSFIQGILVMLGFIMLIVPGFFVVAWTFAAPIILVLERDSDIMSALRRSRELARDQVGHIWGTLLLSWFCFGMVCLLLRIAVWPLVALLHIEGPGLQFLYGVGYSALQAFIGVVGAMLYYDLRARDTLYRYPAMPVAPVASRSNVSS
jgi:uncharacterized protein UPF0259